MIFDDLLKIRDKPHCTVAGIMSGTSSDGIDVAVCEVTEKTVKILHFGSTEYEPSLQKKIRGAISSPRAIAELDVAIGEAFAAACLKEIDQKEKIDLIGSHGQTIYHHSRAPDAKFVSLQLGCGDTIATKTNCPVVFDFRRKDTALGGEGAPITPYTDSRLYGPSSKNRVVLNLGGIANITVLPAGENATLGFDIGPANAPIDRVVRLITHEAEAFDRDGTIARSGTVNARLLNTLFISDPFVKLNPPKSTGFESYGDDYVSGLISLQGGADADLVATLSALVALVLKDALNRYVPLDVHEIIVAGGGSKNSVIVDNIRSTLPGINVLLSDDLNIPAQAREAASFAVLARDFVFGVPSGVPSITGVSRPCCLGKIAFPN